MESSLPSLLPYLVNGGVALVVFFMIVMGALVPAWRYKELREENDDLKEALRLERVRGDTAVSAATTTRDILLSLQGKAVVRSDEISKEPPG